MHAEPTLLDEPAEILEHRAHEGAQYTLRLAAPGIAARAAPGQFVHLACGPQHSLRRPLSILRVGAGWVELLYKVLGSGTRALSAQPVGAHLAMLGPAGVPFVASAAHPRALLLGGGVGMPPMIFLAERLKRAGGYAPLVLLGSEAPFPFRARPSTVLLPGMPAGVIAAMPLLEDWGIASRLSSLRGQPGVYEGYVTDLAQHWLASLDGAAHAQVQVFACGPEPMLAAAARLAARHGLPCQVCVEEFMACAVGGCAGCVIRVHGAAAASYKRVCVDGPVFDARAVYPDACTLAA